MACDRCGKCEGRVGFTITPDYADFVRLHGIPVSEEQGELKVIIAAPCDWYDPINKLCKNYEQRPKICREYLCEKARRED